MPLKLCMILGKEGERLSRVCNECPGIGDAPLWAVVESLPFLSINPGT